MIRLLTIDPGTHTGLALFRDGRLMSAHALAAPPETSSTSACPLCCGRSCSHRAGKIAALLLGLVQAVPDLGAVDVAAIEVPAYWRSTPDLPALLDLATTAGAYVGAAVALGVPEVLTYRPREWKGTRDKADFQREILACLSEAERALLPRAPRTGRYLSDPLDAVGLGLFMVGRQGRWACSPACFAGQVEQVPRRGKRTRQHGGAQEGLALFGTGPNGTPAALHADDVDGLLDDGAGQDRPEGARP